MLEKGFTIKAGHLKSTFILFFQSYSWMATAAWNPRENGLFPACAVQYSKSTTSPGARYQTLQTSDISRKHPKIFLQNLWYGHVDRCISWTRRCSTSTTLTTFTHGIEVDFERFSSTSEAVKAGKRRAFPRYTSSLLEMAVSLGEGRATRELELIWWPNICIEDVNIKGTVQENVSTILRIEDNVQTLIFYWVLTYCVNE